MQEDCCELFFTIGAMSVPWSSVGDDLSPTERWGDRSQNCLHDMRIVGNT